jgi:ABC-type glycerol-3-phosphate transport system permease component
MRHVPADVVDAAQLDGAGRWVTLTRVVWPLMLPTVLTVALLLYVFNWNEYLLSLLLLPDTSSYTVPIAISAVDYGQRGGAPGQLVAAGAVLGSLPSLIIFLFFQRTLVRGITAGASSG